MYTRPQNPQDLEALLRLIATIEHIETTDQGKAPICRELLAKLRRHTGGPEDDSGEFGRSIQASGEAVAHVQLRAAAL